MISYCLFTQLTGSPTPGGTWTYTSGPVSIQVGTCPVTPGQPCTGTLTTKNVGQVLGVGSNICVTISTASAIPYVFTYDVSALTGCCTPCTSTVTINASTIDLTLSGSVSTCTDTFSIINGLGSAACCSTDAALSLTARINSSCFGSFLPVTSLATQSIDAYTGWDILYINECSDIYSMQLTGFGCSDSFPVTLTIGAGTGSCSGFNNCSCSGDADVYVKCVIEELIQTSFGPLYGITLINGIHYNLTVTKTGTVGAGNQTLHIRFKIKEFNKTTCCATTPDCIWIGPRRGVDICKHNYIAPPCNAPGSYNMNTPASLYISSATAAFSISPVGFCSEMGPYNLTVTIGNLLSSLSDINHIAFNSWNVWTILSITSTPPGLFVNAGGGIWQHTCLQTTLTATSSCGTPNWSWSTGASGNSIIVPSETATDSCWWVKLICGSCIKCMHICKPAGGSILTPAKTGKCTCPCGIDCTDCT